MMVAHVLSERGWQKLRLTKSDMRRMLAAGAAWGTATSAGIVGMTYCDYGIICLDQIAFTTAVSVAAGIIAVGPLALLQR